MGKPDVHRDKRGRKGGKVGDRCLNHTSFIFALFPWLCLFIKTVGGMENGVLTRLRDHNFQLIVLRR